MTPVFSFLNLLEETLSPQLKLAQIQSSGQVEGLATTRSKIICTGDLCKPSASKVCHAGCPSQFPEVTYGCRARCLCLVNGIVRHAVQMVRPALEIRDPRLNTKLRQRSPKGIWGSGAAIQALGSYQSSARTYSGQDCDLQAFSILSIYTVQSDFHFKAGNLGAGLAGAAKAFLNGNHCRLQNGAFGGAGCVQRAGFTAWMLARSLSMALFLWLKTCSWKFISSASSHHLVLPLFAW